MTLLYIICMAGFGPLSSPETEVERIFERTAGVKNHNGQPVFVTNTG